MKVWVDDIRHPPCEYDVWFLNSKDTIHFLGLCMKNDLRPSLMSLDHDLGGDDTSRAIVLWCCENDWWPVEVRVHSANYVGVEWLEGMIERYHPDNAHKYTR